MSWKASGAAKEITCGTKGQKLKIADKLVLMILSDDYNEGRGFAWPSQETLAEECLCTDRGLRGILERLASYGLIEIEHRGRKGNRYKLLFALKTGKSLRNAVPQSDDGIEERDDDLEEREPDLEERAGSLQPLVEPIVKPIINNHPSKSYNKKSKPPYDYSNFVNRYYALIGTTPDDPPWLLELYEPLCVDFGEDAVLDEIEPWAKSQGGIKSLTGNKYGPGKFLKQVRVMLEQGPPKAERDKNNPFTPQEELDRQMHGHWRLNPDQAPKKWREENGYDKPIEEI